MQKAIIIKFSEWKVKRNFCLDKNTVFMIYESYIFGKAIAGALYSGGNFMYAKGVRDESYM